MITLAAETSKVRLAVREDESELLDMCKALHCESGLRDGSNQPFPFCEDMALSTIQKAIVPNRNDPEAGKAWIGIIGDPGQLEGSVYLSVINAWYSPKPFLAEIWNFVAPPYRRTNHARTLIAFSKAFAGALDMPLVMGVMSTERAPAKERLYRRHIGVQPSGAFFVYNADTTGVA